jgi:hypothetical protein
MKTALRNNLWPGVGLIFLFWLTRLPTINEFPPFLDESIHVYFGEASFQTSPLAFAHEGRLFTVWWYMLFQPHQAATLWVVRVATLLVALVSVAAIIGVGRLAAGFWGGLTAGLVYLFSTYHLFFERLALADSVSGAAISVGLYFAYRLSRRVHFIDALLTGAAIFVAIGFKISALPYLGIPIAAALTLRPNSRTWRKQLQWLAVALGTGVGFTGIYAVGLRVLDYDLFYLIGFHNVGVGNSILNRIIDNVSNTIAALSTYTWAGVFILLSASVIILARRRRFYLPLCLIAPMLVLLVSERQSIRFYIAPMTILLLCGAVVFADEIIKRRGRYALLLIFVWGALQWLPFTTTSDLSELNLSPADYTEYIKSDASGFGLAEVYAYLRDRQPVQVIGLLPNCQSLRYMALGVFTVTCPRVNPNGSDIETLAVLMTENRHKGIYVVLEDSPYVPARAPGQLLKTITRPQNGPSLTIYDLAPS